MWSRAVRVRSPALSSAGDTVEHPAPGARLQVLDKAQVKLVAEKFGVEVLEEDEARVQDAARKTTAFLLEEDLEFLQPRPPVVTIMGHVDHGKTSLLDSIRKTRARGGPRVRVRACEG